MPIALVRLPGPRHSSRSGSSEGAAALDHTGAAAPHDRDAVPRIERADEHGRGKARRLGHDVHQAVNAVIQIDVRMAGRTIQRLVAPGRPRRRMTGGIGLADVRFDLDDDAAGDDAAPPMHENLAQEIACDVERRPIVESTRELHDMFSCQLSASAAATASSPSARGLAARSVRVRPAFGERRAKIPSGVRRLDLRDLLRRPGRHHHPAAFAAFRAEIDDVVRGLDHVEIVLDDEQRVARLEQLPERGQQLRDVVEVQAGRRLIENVEQPFAAMRRQMRGNLDPLRLAPDSVVAGWPSRR